MSWPREFSGFPKVIDGQTMWACCVSSIGPACRHQWVPCIACGDYFDPTTTETTSRPVLARNITKVRGAWHLVGLSRTYCGLPWGSSIVPRWKHGTRCSACLAAEAAENGSR